MSNYAVACERALVLDRVRRTAVLTRMGESASEIAVRLKVSQRTVERYRARIHGGSLTT